MCIWPFAFFWYSFVRCCIDYLHIFEIPYLFRVLSCPKHIDSVCICVWPCAFYCWFSFVRCVIDYLYISEITYLFHVLSSAKRIDSVCMFFYLKPSTLDICLCDALSIACTYLKYPIYFVSYWAQIVFIGPWFRFYLYVYLTFCLLLLIFVCAVRYRLLAHLKYPTYFVSYCSRRVLFQSACVFDLLPTTIDLRLCGAAPITCAYLKCPTYFISYSAWIVLRGPWLHFSLHVCLTFYLLLLSFVCPVLCWLLVHKWNNPLIPCLIVRESYCFSLLVFDHLPSTVDIRLYVVLSITGTYLIP